MIPIFNLPQNKNSVPLKKIYTINQEQKEIFDWGNTIRNKMSNRRKTIEPLPKIEMKPKLKIIANDMVDLYTLGFFRYSMLACGIFTELLLKEHYSSSANVKFNDLIQKAKADSLFRQKDSKLLDIIQGYRNEYAHEILDIKSEELESENKLIILMVLRLMGQLLPEKK